MVSIDVRALTSIADELYQSRSILRPQSCQVDLGASPLVLRDGLTRTETTGQSVVGSLSWPSDGGTDQTSAFRFCNERDSMK